MLLLGATAIPSRTLRTSSRLTFPTSRSGFQRKVNDPSARLSCTSCLTVADPALRIVETDEGAPTILLRPARTPSLTALSSQVIHLSGFTPSELEAYRQQIFVNVRDGMRAVFQVMEEEGLDFADSGLAVWQTIAFRSQDQR